MTLDMMGKFIPVLILIMIALYIKFIIDYNKREKRNKFKIIKSKKNTTRLTRRKITHEPINIDSYTEYINAAWEEMKKY